MKIIRLEAGVETRSAVFIKTALEHDGTGRGIPLDQMRRRLRMLDALEKAEAAGDSLTIEDADYDLLKSLYAVCPWNVARVDIVHTADAIDAAETA